MSSSEAPAVASTVSIVRQQLRACSETFSGIVMVA
jgi:hypothetical protein